MSTSAVWYKEHKEIPTIEEVLALRNMLTPSQPGYEKQMKLLVWYFDTFLAKLVGDERWGADKRYHALAVSSSKEDIYGKKRTLVTAQSEAWGLMMLTNCGPKWKAYWAKKDEDPSWKLPPFKKLDVATHIYYKCKYSDAFAGQKSGWDVKVFKLLDDYSKKIQAFRNEDSKNQWAYFKAVKTILRKTHGISETVPIPVNSNKKRKHAATTLEVDFIESDVESEDYSVASEGPEGPADNEEESDDE